MCLNPSTAIGETGFWRPGDNVNSVQGTGAAIYKPDIYKLIEKKIEELNEELRVLSLDIHG